MADTFRGIITADGKKRQLPYGSILEAPVSDETLSIQGGFADAKVVGDNFKKTKAETDSLKEDLDNTKSQLSESIAENLEMFTSGKNLINSDTFSALGEWCNYTNGLIESTQYTTTYRHSEYILVKPNTAYSRRYNSGKAGTVFFDSKKSFISGVQTDIFTTPENCTFLIYNTDSIRENDYHQCVLIEGNEIINSSEEIYPTPPFYNDFAKPNPNYVTKEELKLPVVTVGTNNADFKKIGDAFTYARENDLEVLIMPGEYDLVSEGISGNGYILPRKVTGYNAILKCHLPSENWDLSPLNTDYRYDSFEVYGLTVDIKNCRYCIHDEMGALTNGTYKNVFKDLHLINRSNASNVLIAPNNIGGGCGNGGYIEITNCVMEQLGGWTKKLDYHSSFTGKQTGEVIIKMTGCYLDKRVTISNIGDARENHNKMYVSNCKISTLPTDEVGNNFDMITWNNVQ